MNFASTLIFSTLIALLTFNSCAETPLADTAENRARFNNALMLYEKIKQENDYTLRRNGVEVKYLDFGPEKGVPLIWSHGSESNRYEIVNVKDGLVKAGYRVISVDFQDHSSTTIFNYQESSVYDVAERIALLMDHLGITRAVMGGWSQGGFVAAAFYDDYPDRVLGLLLEDGGSWSFQKKQDDLYERDGEQWSPFPANIDEIKEFMNRRYTSRYSAFLAVGQPSQSNEAIVIGLAGIVKYSDGQWGYYLDMDSYLDLYQYGFEKRLPSRLPLILWSLSSLIPEVLFRDLKVPVTIIDPVSANDRFPVTEQNRKLTSQHRKLIRHEIYEDTGHAAHFIRPMLFIESAKALLERVQSAGASQ